MPTSTPPALPRLRDLGVGARLGLTAIIFVLIGGLLASAAHLKFHHENRDEEPGVSVNDIKGAYHGVTIKSPLLQAIERGHPTGLSDHDRKILVDWLNSAKISENYDNLDLGDQAPAEVIARDCVSCHSDKAAATQPVAAKLPLANFDQVKKIAFTKKLDPPGIKIVAMSTHAHALSLGTLSIVVILLLMATRIPGAFKNGASLLMGLGLAADLASWWLARGENGMPFVYVIIVSGAAYSGITALSLLAIFLDLWMPRRN